MLVPCPPPSRAPGAHERATLHQLEQPWNACRLQPLGHAATGNQNPSHIQRSPSGAPWKPSRCGPPGDRQPWPAAPWPSTTRQGREDNQAPLVDVSGFQITSIARALGAAAQGADHGDRRSDRHGNAHHETPTETPSQAAGKRSITQGKGRIGAKVSASGSAQRGRAQAHGQATEREKPQPTRSETINPNQPAW